MQAIRNGTHPIDAEVHDRSALHWVIPGFMLVLRQWSALLPAAVVNGLVAWLFYAFTTSDMMPKSQFGQIALQTVFSLISAGITGWAYMALVRQEGAPYGLADLPPTAEVMQQLMILLLAWVAIVAVLSYALEALLPKLFEITGVMHLIAFLFTHMGMWALAFVMWLFSPLYFLMSATFILSQVLCIRTAAPTWQSLSEAATRVWRQSGRLFFASYLIMGALLLVLFGGVELFAESALEVTLWLARAGTALFVVMGVLAVLISIPFWFVIERAYAPELGVESDLDLTPNAINPPSTASPLISVAELQEQLRQVYAEQGAEAYVEQLKQALTRARFPKETIQIITSIGDPNLQLRVLREFAGAWCLSHRHTEGAAAIELGLSLDAKFLMDQPDLINKIARSLVQQEKVPLAVKILVSFLKNQRQHPEHMNLGILLVRVLALHANNREAAIKVLETLTTLYPNATELPALRKLLQL